MIKFLFLLLIVQSSSGIRTNKHLLNISRNQLGLDPINSICTYDDIAKKVSCRSAKPENHLIVEPQYFSNVYIRKLTSDPVGIIFIGNYRNPDLNPGHPTEYTSTAEIFSVYTSKY